MGINYICISGSGDEESCQFVNVNLLSWKKAWPFIYKSFINQGCYVTTHFEFFLLFTAKLTHFYSLQRNLYWNHIILNYTEYNNISFSLTYLYDFASDSYKSMGFQSPFALINDKISIKTEIVQFMIYYSNLLKTTAILTFKI